MPNGFGVARVGVVRRAARRGRGRHAPGRRLRPARRPATALGGAAIEAVQRLAAAAGHRLGGRAAPSARRRERALRATGIIAWLAFAVGAIVIAVAWTISLRAAPAASA